MKEITTMAIVMLPVTVLLFMNGIQSFNSDDSPALTALSLAFGGLYTAVLFIGAVSNWNL